MSDESGTSANTNRIEAVFRFRVPEDKQNDFRQRVKELVSEARDSHPETMGEASIQLLHALVGSDPFEWELRITVPTMAVLGSLLDQWSATPEGRRRSLLGDLLKIDGANVVDSGIPAYRVQRL